MSQAEQKIEAAFTSLRSTVGDVTAQDQGALRDAVLAAGLAVVDAAEGAGGLGIGAQHQPEVDERLAQMGIPQPDRFAANINYGQAIPALRLFGTPEQQRELIPRLWKPEVVCCQLFSEPEAGSDLAGVRTSATPVEGGWRIRGHKVWTSLGHKSDIAILVARTSDKPRHKGLSFFFIDMHQEGVRVEPLRQITGEAEFNEVFLEDAFVPDRWAIGGVDGGWKVAMGVLEVERAFYEGAQPPRESGPIAKLASTWREARAHGTAPESMRSDIVDAWLDAEVSRLANRKLAERIAAGEDATEASVSKLRFAENIQRIARLTLDLTGPAALQQAEYGYSRPDRTEFASGNPVFTYLRTRATSIEGGTTEIQRNIIADRLIGLPRPARKDAR